MCPCVVFDSSVRNAKLTAAEILCSCVYKVSHWLEALSPKLAGTRKAHEALSRQSQEDTMASHDARIQRHN